MELFIFARFHAREGHEAAVEAVLREQTERVPGEQGCLAIQQIRNPVPHVGDLPVALRRVAPPDDRYLRSARREDSHHFPAQSARAADDQSM